MSLHRRAAKRDSNEPAIVSALEALGCVVWRVSGKGLPDLIVLHRKGRYFADVKGPKEKATPAQAKAWDEAATKARCSVFILRTPEDAQKMLNNALQPWEPSLTKAQIKKGVEMIEKTRTTMPRKGDAVKSRDEGLKRLGMGHGIERLASMTPAERRKVEANYTPPLSTPVDAAKEAESTFAPRNPCCGNYEAFGIHAEVCEHYAG